MTEVTWRVPGRLEVLGKHTDYAGGPVLVCAIDKAVTATAWHTGEAIVASTDASPETVCLRAGVDPQLPDGHWGRYLQTVVDRLSANFGPLEGCRLAITSDLPLASGMSSSSALLSACALSLASLNCLDKTAVWRQALPDRLSLAGYLACIENGRTWGPLRGQVGVGTFGGSEDHTAMMCGVPGQLSQFEFDPLRRVTDVPMPRGFVFVVATSGVPAEKTAGARDAYNRASLGVRAILDRWNAAADQPAGSLAAAVAHDPEGVRLKSLVADDPWLSARLRQFLGERTIVTSAVAALNAGDLDAFGELVSQSQGLAETDLGNQVPETIALAASARTLGARAASAFGAGFGGSVWALVEATSAAAFADAWLTHYLRTYPSRTDARTLIVSPSEPGQRLR